MKSVLAIVPAHDERKNLPLVIKGLKSQTYPITICIVSDNSTDGTAALAIELGADIVTATIGNTGMRAGAINWGLDHFSEGRSYVPDSTTDCFMIWGLSDFFGPYDYVLAMDADSTCDPHMIEEGVKSLEEDFRLGAVCSRAGVQPQPELKTLEQKLLWHLQHLEYGEYDSSRVETTNRIKVAHGLATLFRREALDQQRARYGYIYNNDSLCEDYWLTMDLKELGWNITSCQKMKAWTIVPTTFKWLWKQRSRWNLGGVDTIFAHGLNRITFWDVFAHVMSCILLAVEGLIFSLVLYLLVLGERIYLSWMFWAVFAAIWLNGMYRLRYCQNPDKWDILLRVSALPMELYYYYLMATLVNGYRQYLKGVKRSY